MNQIKKKNIEQGAAAEKRLLPKLRERFDKRLAKGASQYQLLDFYGRDAIVELKSRNISMDDFKETIVGWNKIKECEKIRMLGDDRKFFFVFEFTEGLYYWRYSKKKVDAYKVDFMGTMKRGVDERKDHLLIPIENLKVIEEY